MNPDVLKIMAITAGSIVSLPILLAAGRAFFFFGTLSRDVEGVVAEVKSMGGDLKASTVTMTEFQGHVIQLLDELKNRVTTIEAERRVEKQYGRRMGDQPPDDLTPGSRQ